jgi:hypothetical protein
MKLTLHPDDDTGNFFTTVIGFKKEMQIAIGAD